ncbi:M6 family metalloprotease domain-containing protein [Candidatus Neomarinimicrobiota bacterium]
MKHIGTYLLILGLLGGTTHLRATAPHPGVTDLVRQGILEQPYYLKNLYQLRQAGVDNPYVIRKLALSKGGDSFDNLRTISTPNDWNILVILIDFSDKQNTVEAAFFDSLMFDSTHISVRDYYREVSYGDLDLVTVNFPSQTGWQRADSISTYYTTDASGTPNGGLGDYPRNAQKLVEEAVLAVDPYVDFNDYDNDRNGYVDGLLIVHAGTGGEAEGNEENIWSHSWATNQRIDLEIPSNRVWVHEYAIVPEYWLFEGTLYDMTIGVVAHELGHSLFGLPDLYDTDGSSNGLSGWSLMASGSWNGPSHIGGSPSHPDAWSRAWMGLATPLNVSANLISQSIGPIEIQPSIYKLWTDGKPGKEYFLVEHRMWYGYDQYLPWHGLLIYHVDEDVDLEYIQNKNEWYPGYTDRGHYLVALEQADGDYGLEQNEWSDTGDPFPGNTVNAYFSNITSPASLAYNGAWTNVAITDITDLDTGIVASLIVVSPQSNMPEVTIADVPQDEGGLVSISWRPITADSGAASPVSGYAIWLQDSALIYQGNQSILPYNSGQWVHRISEPATGDTLYEVTARTLVDSNAFGFQRSYFRIAALTSDSLVIGLSGIVGGYSVDNLRPLPPINLTTTFIGGVGVRLAWDFSPSTDLGEYRIYRGESSGFLPAHVDSFLAVTVDTVYFDTDPNPVTPYYRVTAVDTNGNLSNYTPAIAPDSIIVSNALHAGIPASYRLYQNYPNPFNPNTAIRFDLPLAIYVRILIFDLQGREIRRLTDGQFPPGQHLAQWDGRSSDGRESPSGIYIVRLETSRFIANRKMILLK